VIDTVIVIPTYWTWGRDKPKGPHKAFFDHPTPLDGESTLPRLLDSLTKIAQGRGLVSWGRPPFAVLVLTATVHAALAHAAEKRVNEIIAPFQKSFPIVQFTTGDLAVLHQRLQDYHCDGLVPFLSLRSYAGVRNCQLVVPYVLGAGMVVALDDDETVPSDYWHHAHRAVGTSQAGARIVGVAGPYLDAKGSYLLPEHPRTGNIFLDKSAILNEATRTMQQETGQLVRSNMAFGGNMVFHRDLFARIGFDPGIARGEDMDYLINARLQGFDFWFDWRLAVTHLPPDVYQSSNYSKLRQDVMRFVYEREKLRQAGADPAQFDPYPGRFMREDLEAQALEALQKLATPADVARFGSPQEVMAAARRQADEVPHYSAAAEQWAHCVETLGHDPLLQDHWAAKLLL
jgi:hypothetical protein